MRMKRTILLLKPSLQEASAPILIFTTLPLNFTVITPIFNNNNVKEVSLLFKIHFLLAL